MHVQGCSTCCGTCCKNLLLLPPAPTLPPSLAQMHKQEPVQGQLVRAGPLRAGEIIQVQPRLLLQLSCLHSSPTSIHWVLAGTDAHFTSVAHLQGGGRCKHTDSTAAAAKVSFFALRQRQHHTTNKKQPTSEQHRAALCNATAQLHCEQPCTMPEFCQNLHVGTAHLERCSAVPAALPDQYHGERPLSSAGLRLRLRLASLPPSSRLGEALQK
jgi:hypothetical protein